MKVRHVLLVVTTILGLTVAPSAARGVDRYYMMIFACQATPNVVEATHSFALFVKVGGEGQNPRDDQIQVVSISWMPRTLKLEPLKVDPEPAVNLSLARTLEWAGSVKASVSMWGPYPVKKDLYDLAVQQAERLNGGKIQYITLDTKQREKGAINCIHAVSDMDTSQPLLNTGTSRGNEASEKVLTHLEPFILKPRDSNRWLVNRLSITPDTVRFVDPDLTKP